MSTNPKTYSAKLSELDPQWYVIDADGMILGRLATQVAQILRGKHKPSFTPHMNCGDFVIVVNASKIAVTGKRLDQKMYYRHSQYPGGFKTESLRHLLARKPEAVIERAVKGMLPHNRLGADILGRLKVYGGAHHPHKAQQPVTWEAPQAEIAETAEASHTTTATTGDHEAAANN
ncbi:MAG TPA: 50S ribosomal protein L13 [Ktedonobacterales bacterium]|nr:50S ribosomal protein L13 [Ktedonobacterales bacterium]